MKQLFIVTFLSLALNSQAASYLCQRDLSFAENYYQIDIGRDYSAFCSYQKNGRGYDLIESGTGEQVERDVTRGVKVDFYTEKRVITMYVPNKEVEEFTARAAYPGASDFGPLVPASGTTFINLICKKDENIKPCEAYEFSQPENTPKNFEALKANLQDVQIFSWGAPTFTLVSPDLEDHVVVTNILYSYKIYKQNGVASFIDMWNGLYYIRESLLKKGWTLVPVYSNEKGINLFTKSILPKNNQQ